MHFPILAYCDLISNILPVGAGLRQVHRTNMPMFVFFLLVVSSGISDVFSFVLGRMGIHNLWMIQLHHLLDYVVMTLVLTAWQRGGLARTLQRWTIVAYVLVWIFAKFSFEPLVEADQFTHTTASILILCTAIITLFQLAQDEEIEFLHDSRFWIAGGVLIYFAGNFLLFSVFGKIILLPSVDAAFIWNVHWGVNVIVNLLYMGGFLALKQ